MAQVCNTKHFNNLLETVSRNRERDALEHQMARVPLDLSYKGQSPVEKLLLRGAEQINGKQFDIKYQPKVIRSTPNYGYDARIDPTILNAVRNRFVDVAGLLIPARNLTKDVKMNYSRQPLKMRGIIV